jgi:hypothetical protein
MLRNSTRAIAAWRLERLRALSQDRWMRVSTAKIDCPAAPPSRQTTYARALHRACLILGGVPQLASHLGVSESALRAWLQGRDDPPQMVFLAAVEIVLLHLEKSGSSYLD